MASQNPDAILNRIIKIKEKLYSKLSLESNTEEKEDIKSDIASINRMLECLEAYTKAAFLDEEKTANLKRFKDECHSIEEYQYKIAKSDEYRKSKHDALIVSIKVADKICECYNEEPIYGELGIYKDNVSEILDSKKYKKEGVLETRKKIANWGFNFVISSIGGIIVEKDVLKRYNEDNECLSILSNTMKKMDVTKTLKEMSTPEKNYHER